jgi:hypothetical protein
MVADRNGMAAAGTPAFTGRARERTILDRLVDRVRDGDSSVLIIRGPTDG